MTQNLLITLTVIFLVALVLGAIIFCYFERSFENWRLRRRLKRGVQGEGTARAFLKKHGFTILAEQVELTSHMWIDGQKTTYSVRADFLVKKGSRKGIVEVKTGTKAIDPVYAQTRRQIFEYARLYEVDDVFLFDAENEVLKNIQFTGSSIKPHFSFFLWIFGFIAGFVIALLLACY
jgi:Holliday junction resolvase-like predicted endonuclease